MSDKLRAELAPTGILRAGINLSNFLLVTGRTADGDPVGVAPDVAKGIADSIGVPIKYVSFKSPGELADQAGKDVWDIGLIGAEPQRAAVMTFSAAYVEIEATYMVPPGSPLKSIADVDKKGVRLVVSARSAYGLWLENNIKNATLIQVTGLDGAFNKFMEDKADALAGLRPGTYVVAMEVPAGWQQTTPDATGIVVSLQSANVVAANVSLTIATCGTRLLSRSSKSRPARI